MPGLRPAALGSLLLCPLPVLAHSFGRLYTLPVPFWMYAWGAAAALIASFAMVGWFVSQQGAAGEPRSIDLSNRPWARLLLGKTSIGLLKTLALAGLLLCIATGLAGTANAYLNFNMTFFWIIFLLGFSYFSTLFGGLYTLINPWQTLVECVARLTPAGFEGRFAYPARLGCWPALALYMALIWIELFGGSTPHSLALMLIGYCLLNLAGAWLFGARAWFSQAESFSLLFRLISKMAPLQYRPPPSGRGRGRLILQAPFAGLLPSRAASPGELLFILFILSSTAFDGLHQTDPWARLYWQDIAGWLKPLTGDNIVHAYPLLKNLHAGFQTTTLLLSPFLYLLIYLLSLAILRRITRTELSLRELALRFAYSLLPIALVYHITHYYTLIQTQGLMILRLVSDPFGAGWNLFGTAHWLPEPIIPDMDWVWHTQVWLILLGHIVSVYIAHREALRLFPERRTASLSQLPILVLMIAFTCFGLWILAQPITSTVIP